VNSVFDSPISFVFLSFLLYVLFCIKLYLELESYLVMFLAFNIFAARVVDVLVCAKGAKRLEPVALSMMEKRGLFAFSVRFSRLARIVGREAHDEDYFLFFG